jgi:dihydrofolate reductase
MKLIVATDEEGGIGRGGKIPWGFPEDLQLFKFLTTGSTVLMGRKTFESIRRLKSRLTVVLTGDETLLKTPDTDTLRFISEDKLHWYQSGDVWLAGGSQVYAECLNRGLVHEIYQTLIPGTYNCDTFFTLPECDQVAEFDNGLTVVRKFLL